MTHNGGPVTRKTLVVISKRILVAEFDGNPKTTIIVFYSPTNCAKEEDIGDFYTEMRKALQEVPDHNFLVCLGDANARLPSSQRDPANYGPSRTEHLIHCAS